MKRWFVILCEEANNWYVTYCREPVNPKKGGKTTIEVTVPPALQHMWELHDRLASRYDENEWHESLETIVALPWPSILLRDGTHSFEAEFMASIYRKTDQLRAECYEFDHAGAKKHAELERKGWKEMESLSVPLPPNSLLRFLLQSEKSRDDAICLVAFLVLESWKAHLAFITR